MTLNIIDCTLRDGGYYNDWDFPRDLIVEYLQAMAAASIDYVELGFRSFDKQGFKGACAYTTDNFIRSLPIPANIRIGVMMNAAELVNHPEGPLQAAKLQFTFASESPVTLVRFACHVHEFETMLPVCKLLKEMGYMVGINLMQVADRSEQDIENIAKLASNYDLDALYFADSMGSLDPVQTTRIVQALKRFWKGALGIHTHDNMGRAMANTLAAIEEGATWVDSTVTGMGRGPGNVQTEYVVIELEPLRSVKVNLTPLLVLIKKHFKPMQIARGWGANPFYYMAGQYGIHPTYIQEMMSDPRYEETEILSVINHLKVVGGKKFSSETMEAGRQQFGGASLGSWKPAEVIAGRDVLIVGSGPGVRAHQKAIEEFIGKFKPYVIGLNTQKTIDDDLIDIRAASQQYRLLADREIYKTLPQPLVVAYSRLTDEVVESLSNVKTLNFGLVIEPNKFEFNENSAVVPTSLVVAYALAIATSGRAKRIYLAGFDGFGADDLRAVEMNELLEQYQLCTGAIELAAITPTRYKIPVTSVYSYA